MKENVLAPDVNVLVTRCLAGQQSAFRELVERYRGVVFGLCYRMLREREDAEDATQETFARVCSNLHRWDSARAFEPWLLTIAGNRCRTRLAKRMRQPKLLVLDYPIPDQSHLEDDAHHMAEEIELVLRSVKADCREAFLLFYRQRLAYQEIADRLAVPLGTVKTWVHRARKELIERLRKRGTIDARSTSSAL